MADANQDHTRHTSSLSGGSAISDLSAFGSEDFSDDFKRRVFQHARDQRRMRDAVDGGAVRVQAFKKARPRPRVSDRMDGNGRQDEDNGGSDLGSERGSLDLPSTHSSVSEGDNFASANVPKQWARKGLQKNNFLRRINSDGPMERPKTPEEDPDVIYKRRTAFTGDSPRSDVEWTQRAADVPLPSTEPDSPSRMRRSPLLESLRRRKEMRRQSSLDLIEELHPDPLQAGDVNGARHAFLRGNTISGHTRTRSLVNLREEAAEADEQASTAPLKGSNTTALSSSEAQVGDNEIHLRPGPRRLGSRDLLRQLARASATPSPPTKPAERPAGRPRSRKTSPSKKQAGSGGKIDHRLPTPPDDEVVYSEQLETLVKTPTASGRWVDTPATRTRKEVVPLSSEKPDDASSLPTEKARLAKNEREPKSALEAVLRSHTGQGADAALGDDTIASLRDLLNDDTTGDISQLLPLDDETLDLINNVNTRVDKGEDLRQDERAQLKRMTNFLKSARSGVRDASKGLKRVESQVEGAEARDATSLVRCSHCGCSGPVTLSSLLTNAARSFWDNFYYRPPKGPGKFTWLGIACLAFLVWFITEVTLW